MEPQVIFVDNHLLVLNKPPQMATQPDLEEWGKNYLQRPYLHAVHRLDKSASGIVVMAKTSKALSRLQKGMREGDFQKTYWIIIEGKLDPKEGKLEDFLVHDAFRAVVDKNGKHSLLFYKVLKEKDSLSLVEVKLITGRYHQIRIQFASRGHPVLGDKKYGSTKEFNSGIALHHKEIIFTHPVSHEKLEFSAPFFKNWPGSSC